MISALDMIVNFKEDYKTVTISDVAPIYSQVAPKAKEAQALLAKQRSHQDNDGFIVPDTYVKIFKELVILVEQLELAREDLNKKFLTTVEPTGGG